LVVVVVVVVVVAFGWRCPHFGVAVVTGSAAAASSSSALTATGFRARFD